MNTAVGAAGGQSSNRWKQIVFVKKAPLDFIVSLTIRDNEEILLIVVSAISMPLASMLGIVPSEHGGLKEFVLIATRKAAFVLTGHRLRR